MLNLPGDGEVVTLELVYEPKLDSIEVGTGFSHIVVQVNDIDAKLVELREKGVTFHRRINHGMTHSVYISDPDGHGIEVLYELPREIWEHDIDAAQNYAEVLPTEGPEAMVDRVDYPAFGVKASPA